MDLPELPLMPGNLTIGERIVYQGLMYGWGAACYSKALEDAAKRCEQHADPSAGIIASAIRSLGEKK